MSETKSIILGLVFMFVSYVFGIVIGYNIASSRETGTSRAEFERERARVEQLERGIEDISAELGRDAETIGDVATILRRVASRVKELEDIRDNSYSDVRGINNSFSCSSIEVLEQYE